MTDQNLPIPQALVPLGAYWTTSGWTTVLNTPYFGTKYIFYQSGITGLAGPAEQISQDLTSLGIEQQVINQVPDSGWFNYETAYQAGIAQSPYVTPQDTGTINYENGLLAEAQAEIDSVARSGGYYIPNQRFYPSAGANGVELNTQVDGVAVNNSWWSGTTSYQIEVSVGNKAGALNSAIIDSQVMPVPTPLAQQYDLLGQLSSTGDSVLVPAAQIEGYNLAYGVGQICVWVD